VGQKKLQCSTISHDLAEKVNEGIEDQDQKSPEERWEKLKSAVSHNNSCHERHRIQEETGCKEAMDNRRNA